MRSCDVLIKTEVAHRHERISIRRFSRKKKKVNCYFCVFLPFLPMLAEIVEYSKVNWISIRVQPNTVYLTKEKYTKQRGS